MEAAMEHILKIASVIDVRTPPEFEQGHYPGAVNIPLHELPHRLDEFRNMKLPIVLYCLSGSRSGMAVSLLKQTGISDVYNGGGISNLLQHKK
jgi:phage shock protein E